VRMTVNPPPPSPSQDLMHPPLGFPRAPDAPQVDTGGGGGGRRGEAGSAVYQSNAQNIWIMHTLVCFVQVCLVRSTALCGLQQRMGRRHARVHGVHRLRMRRVLPRGVCTHTHALTRTRTRLHAHAHARTRARTRTRPCRTRTLKSTAACVSHAPCACACRERTAAVRALHCGCTPVAHHGCRERCGSRGGEHGHVTMAASMVT
jgi:hypothetical protein